eukprot:1982371-Prymnesium_polylepis.3
MADAPHAATSAVAAPSPTSAERETVVAAVGILLLRDRTDKLGRDEHRRSAGIPARGRDICDRIILDVCSLAIKEVDDDGPGGRAERLGQRALDRQRRQR